MQEYKGPRHLQALTEFVAMMQVKVAETVNNGDEHVPEYETHEEQRESLDEDVDDTVPEEKPAEVYCRVVSISTHFPHLEIYAFWLEGKKGHSACEKQIGGSHCLTFNVLPLLILTCAVVGVCCLYVNSI